MHRHVSEREVAHTWPDGQKDDARWEDCTWCATIMFLIDLGYDVPATHAEAERLRDAAGVKPTGASAAWQNLLGIKRRYPQVIIPIKSTAGMNFDTLWANLKVGTVAVAQGSMGAFAKGHNLRRHDPGFAGLHAVEIERRDLQDRVWWDDPLGPTSGYSGQWVSKAQLRAYITKWPGGVTFYARKPPPPITGGPNQGVDDMVGFTLQPGAGRGSVKVKAVPGHPNAHGLLDLTTGQLQKINDGVERVSYGFGLLDKGISPGGGDGLARREGFLVTVPGSLPGKPAWLLATDVVFTSLTTGTAPVPVDCSAQVSAAVAAATGPLNDRIVEQADRIQGIKGKVAAVAADVAND